MLGVHARQVLLRPLSNAGHGVWTPRNCNLDPLDTAWPTECLHCTLGSKPIVRSESACSTLLLSQKMSLNLTLHACTRIYARSTLLHSAHFSAHSSPGKVTPTAIQAA